MGETETADTTDWDGNEAIGEDGETEWAPGVPRWLEPTGEQIHSGGYEIFTPGDFLEEDDAYWEEYSPNNVSELAKVLRS